MLNKKRLRRLGVIPLSAYELMLIAIIVYYFSFNVGVLLLGKSALYYLVTSGSALLLIGSWTKLLLSGQSKGMDSLMLFLLICLIAWNFSLIFRGLLSDISVHGMARILLYPREMLYYITPVIALLTINTKRLSIAFKWWMISIVVAFFISFMFRDVILVSNLTDIYDFADDSDLSFYNYLNIASFIPTSVTSLIFFVICGQWRTNKERLFIYLMIVFALLTVALLGRRGAIASILFYISLIFILKLKYKPLYLVVIAVGLAVIYIIFMKYSREIEEYFPILFNRLTDDTRTWAEKEFYKNFNGDWISYLIGRGSKGTYYSSTYGMRGVIETGYLDLILHGGVISLTLTVSVYLYGFYMGFFHSRNRLVNAMALYLFANILFLYPGTPIDLTLGTYGVWLCVACCSNKFIREDSDFSIAQSKLNRAIKLIINYYLHLRANDKKDESTSILYSGRLER